MGQHAYSSAGNLLVKFACEGDLSSWGKSLGSKVANQTPSDVHCQGDELAYIQVNELLVFRTKCLEYSTRILQAN